MFKPGSLEAGVAVGAGVDCATGGARFAFTPSLESTAELTLKPCEHPTEVSRQANEIAMSFLIPHFRNSAVIPVLDPTFVRWNEVELVSRLQWAP